MRYIRWSLILLLVALAIYHLKPHFADFKQIPNLLINANYFYLFIGALAIVGQYFGDGWLSKILLEISGRKINLKQTVKIAAIDVFAAHILPLGETGAIATSALFYKKLGVKNQQIIFLTIAWGLITNIALAMLLLISLAFLPKLPNIPIHISDIAKTSIILVLGFLILLMPFRKKLLKITERKLAHYPFFPQIKKFAAELKIHKQNTFQNKGLVLKAFLAVFIYFGANIGSLYYCFLAFGATLNIPLVATAYLLSLVASFITLAPAGIGASEATMIVIFLQFGISPALATAGVLTFRVFTFWLPIPAGLLSYLSLKKGIAAA